VESSEIDLSDFQDTNVPADDPEQPGEPGAFFIISKMAFFFLCSLFCSIINW
jgi:hypothetical protein